jgi:putative ABC transport system permease protein
MRSVLRSLIGGMTFFQVLRGLRRTPGFAITVVVSLGLAFALGLVALVVVNAYLLRPLPYPSADRLYHVMYAPPGPVEPRGMSALDWNSVADVVEMPVSAASETWYSPDVAGARPARALRVSRGFLDALGVRVVAGRIPGEAEFVPGSDAALIGHALWRDWLGGDPAVIGRTIRVEKEGDSAGIRVVRVAGVLAPGFWYGRDSNADVDVLVPLESSVRTYMVRLRDNVPPALAESRITEAALAVATSLPPDWPGVRLENAHERYVRALRPIVVDVALAALVTVLIACANAAVLTVLRTLRREKDFGIRLALGSGPARIFAMMFVESCVLCGAALVVGTALAHVALGIVAPLIEAQLGKPAPGGAGALALDARVTALAAFAALGIALMLSALQMATTHVRRTAAVLRRTASADVHGTARLRAALIAVELAGALALMSACGLMVQSALNLLRTDLGFDGTGLVRTRVVLRETRYSDATAFMRFYDLLSAGLSPLSAAPVTFTNWPPYSETPRTAVSTATAAATAGIIAVGPGYFEMLRIGDVRGRDFTAADGVGADRVAIVSESLARRLWRDRDALGSTVHTQSAGEPATLRTIVGIARDVRNTFDDNDASDIYVPYAQGSPGRFASFYMRIGEAAPPVTAMRAIIAGLDPLAIMDDPVPVISEDRRSARTTFLTMLLGVFTIFATVLSLLGVYGVTSYAVQQRRREIAIRIAVGARANQVTSLFLRGAVLVIVTGIAAGLGAAIGLAGILRRELYGIAGYEQVSMIGAAAFIAMTAIAAIWWPARRAARADAMTALKESVDP